MTEDGFKHISVNAADDGDDFVIRAGVARGEDASGLEGLDGKGVPPAGEGLAEQPGLSGQGGAVVAAGGDAPADARKASEPHPRREAAPAKPSSKGGAAGGADSYHATTLEDLDAGRMPLAQRIVIIAAVVLILIAVIYYFVAM